VAVPHKKLNHWKSTKATAEVIYSVAYFLKTTGALGVREAVAVDACRTRTVFTFEPDAYTGKKNQVVVPGEKLRPDCAAVRLSKEGKGLAFASATWHFSTDRMPEKGEGDPLRRGADLLPPREKGGETVLQPLADGAALAVGDEVEAHLSIRARHPAEYVQVRDPRPSGCEPVTLTSGYKWDLGLVRYEEIRDSGTTFSWSGCPGRVHAQTQAALRHGGNVQGRAGDTPVDVRAGVCGVLRRQPGDHQIALDSGDGLRIRTPDTTVVTYRRQESQSALCTRGRRLRSARRRTC